MSKCPISLTQKARMLPSAISILLLFLTFLWYLIHILTTAFQRPKHRKQLPGPWALPIIGNFHMLGNHPHHSLQHLAKKYGPIMSIRLGLVPTIVVSSPKAAELFLKTHDTVFSSRPKLQAAEYISYGIKGIARNIHEIGIKAVAHLAVFLHISQAEDFFNFSRSRECYSIVISSTA
ncbi:hypothetical protein C1H46_002944 [Malus baccata]|uniref:Cytochrome P450 n=1 Tax=Malus baccata TaxID=106549 RepID=A0A540NK41_MALBA|nr:hypothetical protein C1H46_002944 [Malus baccata]